MNKENPKIKRDEKQTEDKFFKQSTPGINRLLKKLGIEHEIVEIVSNEFINYANKAKRMDLGGLTLIDSNKYPINLEFKSDYPSYEELENTLEYSFYLASKYGKPVYSYIISTKNLEPKSYKILWHNGDEYNIPAKTLKQLDADETITRIQNKLNITKDVNNDDLTDISVLTFMNSDKDPMELHKIAINLIEQVNEENSVGITVDDISEVKNLLVLLALKFTDTEEEFDEIERRLKMNGGILQGTVDQLKRIGREEGIEIGERKGREEERTKNHKEKIEMAEKLLKKEMSVEEISELTKLDKEEIKKLIK